MAHIVCPTNKHTQLPHQQVSPMARGGSGRTKQRVAIALLVGLLASLLFFVQDVPIGGRGFDINNEKYQMQALVAPAMSGMPLRIFSCKFDHYS
jgi:hypothetical protein